ncbi:substrate-binding domain-containing protein [Irregularibacter muris]|uniref:Substrate-binding domain-containing protein n=1 Tax=Irregularibacter muris TaxID=1796619 RepID=A0AAE3HCX0_9FIRM|nr:substrate-binding domain-containing protein [Irregularibacter muris]MCR1897921.1 substrate-binding domain-containing protein [Irregularibacter muris]
MKKLLFVLILIMALSFVSCTKSPDVSKSTDSTSENSTVNNSPKFNNQVSNNLMSDTAEKLGITHENYPKINGSTSTLAMARAINKAIYKYDENDHFPKIASKTVPSYKLLIEGEVDMILVPYASSDVLALAEDAGVELEFYPIAAEALVFITPKENKTENITMEQVRKIYLDYGITNWSNLGGPNRELVPICRNSDSGSQSQMDNLILKDKKMHSNIEKNYVELTMEGMLEQVAFYHNGGLDGEPTNSYALGYTLYTFLKSMGEVTGIDEQLKMLAFEGVLPTEESIGDGSYSLTDSYYAVVRSDLPKEHSARSIIDWLQSEDGKASIKELDFIPKR